MSAYFRDLQAIGRSTATIRSYGLDLLRWFRFLWAIGIAWNRATRVESRDFCRWMLLAGKPSRPHCGDRGRYLSGLGWWRTRRRCVRTPKRCCAASTAFTWRREPGRSSIRSRWPARAPAGPTSAPATSRKPCRPAAHGRPRDRRDLGRRRRRATGHGGHRRAVEQPRRRDRAAAAAAARHGGRAPVGDADLRPRRLVTHVVEEDRRCRVRPDLLAQGRFRTTRRHRLHRAQLHRLRHDIGVEHAYTLAETNTELDCGKHGGLSLRQIHKRDPETGDYQQKRQSRQQRAASMSVFQFPSGTPRMRENQVRSLAEVGTPWRSRGRMSV